MRIRALHRLSAGLKPRLLRLRAYCLRWAGRREDAAVTFSRAFPGMFRRDEIRLLYRTTREVEGPGDIAEIGSWKGRTSIVMGVALRDAGRSGCKIYAIDHHLGSEEHRRQILTEGSTLPSFRRNVRLAGVAPLVEELVMDSEEASRTLAERRVRLRMVFIDGAHDEESVRKDILSFLPLLRPGAVVALHDCEPEGEFPGVWKAYQSELAPHAIEVGRAHSLLVSRLRSRP